MQVTLHYAGHVATCHRPTSCSAWDQQRIVSRSCTVQRAAQAALRGTGGGSYHFRLHFNVPQQRLCVAQYRRRVVSLSLYGTSCSLWCRCLLTFVYFIKRGLVSDLCQTRVGRRYDKTNIKWFGDRHSELLTLENHVDLTSFGRHDFSRVKNSLCLPTYHLTFV